MLTEDREKRIESISHGKNQYLMGRIKCNLTVHVVCENVIHYKCWGGGCLFFP